ncbi:MAG: CRISPR-associated protein Cas4 [Prevotella sp.]|jgi:CRISPR-associated exonuclease Cas4
MYSDDDLLMLSGIQHYAFCPRQWALAYVDQQWEDNHLTIEGDWLHRRVDDPNAMELDSGTVRLRSVSVKSYRLGFYGIADLLELYPLEGETAKAFTISRYPGRWRVFPIEYKHGKAKTNDIDEVQLCAQAMCLEEMYDIEIPQGAFFYGETRRRTTLTMTKHLRQRVEDLSQAMHALFESSDIPDAKAEKKCRSCSLQNMCMSMDLKHALTVKEYLKQLNE